MLDTHSTTVLHLQPLIITCCYLRLSVHNQALLYVCMCVEEKTYKKLRTDHSSSSLKYLGINSDGQDGLLWNERMIITVQGQSGQFSENLSLSKQNKTK